EILISESAWEEMTCLFAPSLGKDLLLYINTKLLVIIYTEAGSKSTHQNWFCSHSMKPYDLLQSNYTPDGCNIVKCNKLL
ncbi:hypothetical protein FML69_29850, partial [Raoultella ornithinolytica]|nr:hypothetical protein [Raoultella ornithinolytica]